MTRPRKDLKTKRDKKSQIRPTIHDVARHAGVSPATVSNVLGGQRGVTTDSRNVVMQAAEALGYKSNHTASSLRRGHTKTIGLIVPNLANEFFSRLVTYWETLAASANYEIIVAASQDDSLIESRRIHSVLERRVDGLLVCAAQDRFGAVGDFLSALPPTVLVDRAFGCEGFDTISSDNFDAGFSGTHHLIGLGHRDIVLLTSSDIPLHLRSRIDGHRRAMTEAGLGDRLRIVVGGQSIEACRGAIEQELRRPDRPTAIFASTFFSTLGTIKAMHALNIVSPLDVSLVGFEYSEWMTAFRPYLTAVSQQSERLASMSWDLLMRRIDGETGKPKRMTIPVTLTVRESARPLFNGSSKTSRSTKKR